MGHKRDCHVEQVRNTKGDEFSSGDDSNGSQCLSQVLLSRVGDVMDNDFPPHFPSLVNR
jgi:hypothetical protein